jgi:hypothetical protein
VLCYALGQLASSLLLLLLLPPIRPKGTPILGAWACTPLVLWACEWNTHVKAGIDEFLSALEPRYFSAFTEMRRE